jgi:hypothetical protein
MREFLDQVVNRFTLQTLPTVHRKHFFMNILCTESFCQQKTHNRTLLLSSTLLKHGRQFDYWNQPQHAHARLLPRMSWSWTVLLPSDTHRKPIMSVTAVLLPCVTYLLALPRIASEEDPADWGMVDLSHLLAKQVPGHWRLGYMQQLPPVLNECETWLLTLKDEHELRFLETECLGSDLSQGRWRKWFRKEGEFRDLLV